MQEQAERQGPEAHAAEGVPVGFYHLTRTPLEEALPALLVRTLDMGERALVRCVDAAQVMMLDRALWSVGREIWLPHGTHETGHAARQPIWLTDADECPNGGTFLFRINGAWTGELTGFRRIFDLFDGHDDAAVQQARLRWKTLKQAGHRMTYWKQEPRGWAGIG